jgi:glucose-1-phosphate cytidylyltransferase
MKAVILAGGLGTRLSEETALKPKPMVSIGKMPIIWHIMKIYSFHGISEFVICCGYKGEEIKSFFRDYAIEKSDFTVRTGDGQLTVHHKRAEDWTVTLVDTGQDTMTGGRIKYIAPYLDNEPFCLTYGDGLGNVDIRGSVNFHKRHGQLVTVTAVTPPGRFGVLDLQTDKVLGFREKVASDQYRINAGFFVCDPAVIDYIQGPETIWEQEPMMKIAQDGHMRAWQHDGFWMPMDTLRDRQQLEDYWASGNAPWKVWA